MHSSGRRLTLLLIVLALGGCSHFSKANRDERAYHNYVQKSRMERIKQQQRFRSGSPQMPPPQAPSEPVESSETGPQAMPSDG